MDDFGLSDILSFIVGLLSGLTLKIVYDRSKTKRTTTTQKNNVVDGDMAGRDITKHK